MLAKILAAVAMPAIVIVVVGAILRQTHHTTIPPMKLPVTSSTASAAATQNAPPAQQLSACKGNFRKPFSGIAVKHSPAAKLAAYSKAFPLKQLQIVEFYTAFGKPFSAGEAWQAVLNGQVPLIQLNPRNVSPAQIASGADD